MRNTTVTRKKPQKQENTTKRKSRGMTINYHNYYIKQERTDSIDLKMQAGEKRELLS